MATVEQVAELKQKMAEERAALIAAATGLSPQDALHVPIDAEGEEQWTAVEQLAHLLELERAYTLGLIDGMPLEGFDRTATSPVFGTLTVLQWLRSFYRHDRQHAAQVLGRQSEYRPNFLGKEPNQRRARLELVARRQGQGP